MTNDDKRLQEICCRELNSGKIKDIVEYALHWLQEELNVIRASGSAGKLLRYYDVIKELDIKPWQYSAQGNGAGSLVCFLLGLSETNPLSAEETLYPQFVTSYSPKYAVDITVRTAAFEGNPYKDIMPVSDWLTLIDRMYTGTGKYPTDAELQTPGVFSKYRSMVDYFSEGMDEQKDTDIIHTLAPDSFADALKAEGLMHGTGTWKENECLSEYMDSAVSLSNLITSREDLFEYLINFGIDESTAFAFTVEAGKGHLKKGRVRDKQAVAKVTESGIPATVLNYVGNISYLFPRAHLIGVLKTKLRICWYRCHFPEESYHKERNFEHQSLYRECVGNMRTRYLK